MRFLRSLGLFVKEWVVRALAGKSIPATITKWIMFLVTAIFAVSADQSTKVIAGTSVVLETKLGYLVGFSVGVVWLAMSFTAAWIYYHRSVLRIDEQPITDEGYGYFRLKIFNDGLGISEPSAFVTKVADATGHEPIPALPIELSWAHHERGQRPKISGEIPGILDVLLVANYGGHMPVHLCIAGMNAQLPVDEGVAHEKKVRHWFKASVKDDYGRTENTWLAAEYDASQAVHYRATTETPPFLPSVALCSKLQKRIMTVQDRLVVVCKTFWKRPRKPKKHSRDR